MQPYIIGILIAALVCKIIFWLISKRVRLKYLFRSFTRIYSDFEIHDAPSDRLRTFWKVSNICNWFFWASVVYIAYGFVMSIKILD